MTNKQALREKFEAWAEEAGALPWGILEKHRNQDGSYPGPHYTYMWHAWRASHEALLDELEAAEKRIAEQRETLLAARSHVMQCARLGDAHANGVLQAIDRAAAGKGE